MQENIVIYGATSTLAQHIARHLATNGHRLFLIARSEARLATLSKDYVARGAASVDLLAADLSELNKLEHLWDTIVSKMKVIHKVFVCHGVLGNQEIAQKDFLTAQSELTTNFLSYVAILTPIANQFEVDGGGHITVIGSVAGDRGRQSNYIYGTAKAGLATFAAGLRNRLSQSNVQVLTVKPGFMRTAMTENLDQNFLFAEPEKVAQSILKAVDQKRDVIYVPGFWRLIMLVIRNIPEKIFKRLKL